MLAVVQGQLWRTSVKETEQQRGAPAYTQLWLTRLCMFLLMNVDRDVFLTYKLVSSLYKCSTEY